MWSKKSKRMYYFREEETQMGTPRISPALFDDGAVGLRIVAAMSGDSIKSGRVSKGKARSDPIPIRGRVGPTLRAKEEEEEEDEEEGDDDDDVELSESYTCVITRVGGGTVRKRVYLDAGEDDGVGAAVVDGIGGKFEMNLGCSLSRRRRWVKFPATSSSAATSVGRSYMGWTFSCTGEIKPFVAWNADASKL